MAIFSIDDLRATAPAQFRSASDETLLREYSKSVGMDPFEVANGLGYDPGKGSLTNERLSASADNYQAGLYGVGEAVTGAMGLKSAQQFMRSGRQDNEFQANVASQRAKELGGIDSYTEIGDRNGYVADGLNYLGGLGAQSLPYLGEAVAGGLVTRGLSSGLRAATSAGRAAEATPDVVQAGLAAKKAMDRRALAGGVAASYPSAVGDILSNQRDQLRSNGLDDGQTDLLSAGLGGVAYAGLNALSPTERLLTQGGIGRGIGALDKMQGLKGGLARTGMNATGAGLLEGANETGQEFINQGFGRMAVDPRETFFNEKSNDRFAESFVGGAAMGGVLGGGAGGWRRSNAYTAKQAEEGRTADLLAQRDAEAENVTNLTDVGAMSQMMGFPEVGDSSPVDLGRYGQDWRSRNAEPVGESSLLAAGRAGQQWQGMVLQATGEFSPAIAGQVGSGFTVPQVGGNLTQQQDQQGARAAQERDQRIAAIGQQAQGLGIRNDEGLLPERLRTQSSPVGARPPGMAQTAVANAQAAQQEQQQAQQQQADQQKAVEDARQSMLESVKAKYGAPELIDPTAKTPKHRWMENSFSGVDAKQVPFIDLALERQAKADAKRMSTYGMPVEVADQLERLYAESYREQQQERSDGIKTKESTKDHPQAVKPSIFGNDFRMLVGGAASLADVAQNVQIQLDKLESIADRVPSAGAKATILQKFSDKLQQAISPGSAQQQAAPKAPTATTAPAATTTNSTPAATAPSTPMGVTPAVQPVAPKVAPEQRIAELRAERKALLKAKDDTVTLGDVGDLDETAPAARRVRQIDSEIMGLSPSVGTIREKVRTLLNDGQVLPNGNFLSRNPRLHRRLTAVTGFVRGADGELQQPGEPTPMAQVAKQEGVSTQAISKQLLAAGLSDLHIGRLVANDMGTVDEGMDTADENDATSDSGSDYSVTSDRAIDETGSSFHTSAAKAFGDNLVGVGGADLTLGQKQAEVEANLLLKKAPKAEPKAPTAQDIAFEAKRAEAAKQSFLATLADWVQNGAGRYAVQEWNDRAVGGMPKFEALSEQEQLNWLNTIFRLDDNEQSDQRILDRAFKEASSTIEPNAPIEVDSERQGVSGAVDETSRGPRAAAPTVVVKRKVRIPEQVQTPATQRADEQGRQALDPKVQAQIDEHRAAISDYEKLLACLTSPR